jgi:hypothetical protein
MSNFNWSDFVQGMAVGLFILFTGLLSVLWYRRRKNRRSRDSVSQRVDIAHVLQQQKDDARDAARRERKR